MPSPCCDKMFEDLIPDLQGPARAIVQAAGAAGLLPQVTSTRRSHQAQERLYRRWQAGLQPLPVAPPGTSAHEFGYAFDMVVSPWSALADVGYTWQTWGGVWGSDRDPVHFEYPGFAPPAATENIIQTAASWFNDLPWYVQIWIPISATTKRPMTREDLKRNNPSLYEWLQRTFGIT